MSKGENPNYLDTLAMAYHMTGAHERAVETQREAIDALSPGDAERRCLLEADMVLFLLGKGDEDAAQEFLNGATTERSEALGEENPLLAARLLRAGAWLSKWGEYEPAERLAREAFEMRRQVLSEGHWRTAEAQSILGGCLAGLGRYEEAEQLLLEAYMQMKDSLLTPEIQKREALQRIIDLYEAWGKPEQAAQWRAKLPTTE